MCIIVFQYLNLYTPLQQLFALSNKGIRCLIQCDDSFTYPSVVKKNNFDRGLVRYNALIIFIGITPEKEPEKLISTLNLGKYQFFILRRVAPSLLSPKFIKSNFR